MPQVLRNPQWDSTMPGVSAMLSGMESAAHFETLAVHGGRDDLESLGVHALPIDLSSTYPLPDVEVGGQSYETLATGGRP
jgi:methionine-gamma-lyase